MQEHIAVISNANDRFNFAEYLNSCEKIELEPLALSEYACLVGRVVVGLQIGGEINALEAYNAITSNTTIVRIDREEQSKGFGDTIAKLTSAIGIKPCGGCKERQAKLNEWFPYEEKSK